MKILLPWCVVFSCFSFAATAQVHFNAQETNRLSEVGYSVAERGANHRVWTKVELEPEPGPSGKPIGRVRSYTELANGLHYWEDNQWKESRAEFEIGPDGYAIARRGQHRVIISPILNDERGTVSLECAGQRMRSTLLGLALHDRVTGANLLVAETKSGVVGRKTAANEILFENCSDDLPFDVRLVYEIGGFHQDIILKKALNPAWIKEKGFDPASSTLEIWTEFFEAPIPKVERRILSAVQEAALRGTMADPDVIEEHLDFGSVSIPIGKAYLRNDAGAEETPIAVSKRWFSGLEGRTFLVESLLLSDLQTLTAGLPFWKPEAGRARSIYAGHRPPEPVLSRAKGKSVLTASLGKSLRPPGAILDYPLELTGGLTNLVFQADKTYYVIGTANLYGTTILEGGVVIKYAKNVSAQLSLHGPVDCRTKSYHQAIFTAKDDDTVGEVISGSSGTPAGVYAYAALYWQTAPTSSVSLHNLRISYADYGVLLFAAGGYTHLVRDSQFCRDGTGFYIQGSSSSARLQNLLFFQSRSRAIYGQDATVHAEHLTINQAHTPFSGGTISVTNSIFVWMTNWTTAFTSVNNATNNDSTTFETVGAGAHYLPTNSIYRDAGTNAINPDLAARLRQKTTRAPTIIADCDYTNSTTLTPQATRDTDAPDLGYHYDPIDYALSIVRLKDATLQIAPGTVLGTYRPGGGQYGLALMSGADFRSLGTATDPIRIVRYNTVQEEANTNWMGKGASLITTWNTESVLPKGLFRFTKWSMMAADAENFYGYFGPSDPMRFAHCEFHGGRFETLRPAATFTNCLFNRVSAWIDDSASAFDLAFQNCLFRGGSLDLYHWEANSWVFRDNLFDETTITQDGTFDGAYNGYTPGSTRLNPTNANDVIGAVSYESGPLGNYYLPTNCFLINTGSLASAASAGLYHFCTTTNQLAEGISRLDLSYHYVPVDSSGKPADADGDSIPDYLEDANGNGSADSGETSLYHADTDYDGINDGQELLDGTDPINGCASDHIVRGI